MWTAGPQISDSAGQHSSQHSERECSDLLCRRDRVLSSDGLLSLYGNSTGGKRPRCRRHDDVVIDPLERGLPRLVTTLS